MKLRNRIIETIHFCSLVLLNAQRLDGQSYVPELHNPAVAVDPVVPIRAFAFGLNQVTLLNSPFRHALSLDSSYLLQISPDRLLYRFYKNAGLPVKDSIYGGWESEGLSGHTLGHYLSACSMMYAATGNREFRKRVEYICRELARCQQARHTGYVGAIPNEDSIFGKVSRGDIRSSGFDLNGGWSPWYTVHKLMAGLCDAYLYCGNRVALNIVKGMGDWTFRIVSRLPDSARLRMLNCEYGGMNEVMANLYAFTGEKKYLRASHLFHDEFVLGKLARHIDPMPGKHSNTNVPKAIGCARRYELTGNVEDSIIASFFWETMVKNHSYVIGGNSNYEYCGDAGKLNDRLSDNTCETCNTYNMLKLTRHLFALNPSSLLMDYYERALYNHILASQNPENGMMCYFVPLRMGTHKTFSDRFNTFTCCVGSGMENHAKYAEQIYSHDGKRKLWVNLFIPSKVHWMEKGLTLTQETKFPNSNKIVLLLDTKKDISLNLLIRVPAWCGASYRICLEDPGQKEKCLMNPDIENGYVSINRLWKPGSRIEIDFNMTLYTESMPDNPDRIAFKYGPLVLAGLLGKEKPDPVYGTPVLLTAERKAGNWIQKESEKPLRFSMKGAGKPFDADLVPFYTVYDQYYSVYWDYFSPEALTKREEDYRREKELEKEMEERTIDYFRVGEMQPERDHFLQASERSYVSDALGVPGREARAGNYFSFRMKVFQGMENELMLTYIGDDLDRVFDILVDGVKLAKVEWKGGQSGKFYREFYPVTVAPGKDEIEVRINAVYGKTAGRIFGIRTLKKKP